jgi:tetratricopeptide (TPR) repeat protein
VKRLGKYTVVGKIGSGAMGEVFKAHDPVLNRFVAIKTMAASLAADQEIVQRFQREAQSAARLNHPNIITVFDFGEEDGKLYMSMELLEGHDLKDLIGKGGLRSLAEKLSVMEQICDGLAFAHAQGVVHRDLKPANIHIQPRGRVKIMDFGLARLDASHLTRTGMVMGTPNYMSPEQVRGQHVDARSDVFSLGAVFYELLCGRKAFHAESMHNILFKVVEGGPEPVVTWVPDLPSGLVALVEKALTKDPAQRFQNGAEMREALRKVRSAIPSPMLQGGFAATDEEGPLADLLPLPTMVESAGRTTLMPPTPLQGGAVSGSAALELDRAPTPATRVPSRSQRARTLAGHFPTQVEEAPPEPPSRAPLYILGFLVVVAAAGTFAVVKIRQGRPPAPTLAPADVAREQMGILTEALVDSQVELARVDLENKDYEDAVRQAEQALKLAPDSASARDVLQQAEQAVAERDQVATTARAAFERGDTAAAAEALGRLLVLDPRHPVASELSAALNRQFRSQAQDGRRAMEASRTAAVKTNAGSFDGFSQADRLAKEAEALFGRQEFAVATQKFLESRDNFDKAKRGAEAAARPPSPRVSTAPPPTPRPTVVTEPAPPMTVPPVRPPASGAPPVTAPPVRPPATLPPPSQEPAIRKLVTDFAHAIESKDLSLYRGLKPNTTADEMKRLERYFKAVKSLKVGIAIDSIEVAGDRATVRVSRQDTIDGREMRAAQQVLTVVRTAQGWVIEDMGR